MSAGPISPYSLRRLTPTVEVDEPNFQALIDSGSSGPAIDLHQIWKTIRKHVGVLVAIPIVVTVVVGIREVMLPDLYTASSTILIRSSTPKLLGTDSEGPVQASLTGSDVTGDVDLFLNTKYELLQTSNLALKVIRAEDLGQDPAFTGIKRKPGLLSQLKHRLLGTAAKAGGRWTPPAEALVGGYWERCRCSRSAGRNWCGSRSRPATRSCRRGWPTRTCASSSSRGSISTRRRARRRSGSCRAS